VAASVHAGGYQKSVRSWIRAHGAECGAKPTAFVSVCLAIRSTQPKEREQATAFPRRFLDLEGWHPQLVKVVAGALPYTRYSFMTRWIMKRIAAQAGGDTDTSRDYEYTDWQEVRAFADGFAHLIVKSQCAA
jgi:menaquinone-dependent protoporphyrinogen oxidase